MGSSTSFDLPAEAENQTYVQVSALNGGRVCMPEHAFVTDVDRSLTRMVPSMCFLVIHESNGVKEKLVFDLGIKRDLTKYAKGMQAHIQKRKPIYTDEDTAFSLRLGGLDPAKDIDTVILSHAHWDHSGTPTDFPSSKFVVGSGTLAVIDNGVKYYPSDMFEEDLLPLDRTLELPPPPGAKEPETASKQQTNHTWAPLANFPAAVDYFGDGSMFIVDAPGHLRGHINLLLRIGPEKWIYLGGDCCHDRRIITGEKEIALYDDGHGCLRSVHSDLPTARKTIANIREFVESHSNVEWILAHDHQWAEKNKDKFFPGHI